MKILKLDVKGLPLLNSDLCIDFIAQQRVDDNDKEQLYNIFSNIYTNPALAFIGINASGKTTVLKVISLAISLLNNEALNNIDSKEIFDDLDSGQKVVITAYFYYKNIINKLRTVIEKKVNLIDGTEKLVIVDEILWEKDIHRIKTKKSIFDFNDSDLRTRRNKKEEYLLEDVSIILALNKKQDTNFFLYDMSKFTDHNMLNVLGKYPKEVLTFLDPSIEYLNCKPEGKKVDIRLKFYGKDEINLNNPLALNKYLSSGTIKGLSVFMGAVITFTEGGYLVVDELENHFNSEIVSTLVRFFMDKKINKKTQELLLSY